MKQSRLTTLLSVLIFAVLLLGGKTMAEGATVVLKGKVTDTSDNWLNGAQVTLKPMGVQVQWVRVCLKPTHLRRKDLGQ